MSEERYAIIFSSRTGNTRKLADTIRGALPDARCAYFGEAKSADPDAEMIYVGFWTDKGTADQACLELLGRLRNKKIFLFGTAGFGGSEAYYQKILANFILKLLERGDCVIIPEMDRLGRSKTAIGEELYTFKSREIRLMILELPTTLIDMSNYNNYVAQLMVEAIQNMLLELYAAVAEIEWEKNKKRQREGIEAMKLRGEWELYGRPRKVDIQTFGIEYEKMLIGQTEKKEIISHLNMSTSTYYRYIKQWKELKEKD